MNIEYNWDREDLKKELYKKRKVFNIVCFIVVLLCYLLYISQSIKMEVFDNKWILVVGLLFLAGLIAVLHYSTKLYVYLNLKKNDKKTNNAYGKYIVSADDKSISVTINNQVIKYEFSEIDKFKCKKNMFFINSKNDKLGLTFKKSKLGDNYNLLLDMVKKNINK